MVYVEENETEMTLKRVVDVETVEEDEQELIDDDD